MPLVLGDERLESIPRDAYCLPIDGWPHYSRRQYGPHGSGYSVSGTSSSYYYGRILTLGVYSASEFSPYIFRWQIIRQFGELPITHLNI
jgi:hypothetical protein